MQSIEVELKFVVSDPEGIVRILDKEATPGPTTQQIDTYYNHPARDFLAAHPVKEWLRVRESPKGASLNYKCWHKGEQVVSCDEHETKISDAAATKLLLLALGFTELIVVDKTRRTWHHRGVEYALDQVRGLGGFLEVEAKGDFADVKDATSAIYQHVQELHLTLGPQDFKGYPYLLLEKNGYHPA